MSTLLNMEDNLNLGQEFLLDQETTSLISSLNPKSRSFILLLGSEESARQSFYENLVKKTHCNKVGISKKMTSESSEKNALVSSTKKLNNNSDIAVFIKEDKIWFNANNSLKQLSEKEEKRIQGLSYFSNKLIYFIESGVSIRFSDVQNKLSLFLGLDDINEENRDFGNLEIVVCVSITISHMSELRFREKEKLFEFEKLREKNIKIEFHYFPYVDDYDSSEYLDVMRNFYESSLKNLNYSNCNNFMIKKIKWIKKELKNPNDKVVSLGKSDNLPAKLKEEKRDDQLNIDLYNEVISNFDKFLNVDDNFKDYQAALKNARTQIIKSIADSSIDNKKQLFIDDEEKLRQCLYDKNKIRKRLEDKIRVWKNKISILSSPEEIKSWFKEKSEKTAFFDYLLYIKEKKLTIEKVYNESILKLTVKNKLLEYLSKIDDEPFTYNPMQAEADLNKIFSHFIKSLDKELSSYCNYPENNVDLMNLSKSYFKDKVEMKKNQNFHFIKETRDFINKEYITGIKKFNSDPYKEDPKIWFENLKSQLTEKLNKFEHKIFFDENKTELDKVINEKSQFLDSSIKGSPELILDKIECFKCNKMGGIKFDKWFGKKSITVKDVYYNEENTRIEMKCKHCKKLFSIKDFAGRSYRFEKNFNGELKKIDYNY